MHSEMLEEMASIALLWNGPTAPAKAETRAWMQLRGPTPSWSLRVELATTTVTPTAPAPPLVRSQVH